MANDPQTLTELTTSLADWLNRDDFADVANEIVASAERRLSRDLFTGDREAITTLTATAETVALPADFESVRAMWIEGANGGRLEPMTLGDLQAFYPTSETGTPRHYAVMGSTLYLGPAPSSSTAIKLAYWQGLTPLSDANPTNWLLTDHPDVYRAAAMTEAYLYYMDEAKARTWDAVTVSRMASVTRMGRRRQYGVGPLVARARTAE